MLAQAPDTPDVTEFFYDDAGQLKEVKDARGNTTTNTYGAAGRLTMVTQPDTTFEDTVYDAVGRVTSRKDAAGKVTAHSYDLLGRLTSVTQDPSGLNLVTRYAYDEVGSRTKQTDALTRRKHQRSCSIVPGKVFGKRVNFFARSIPQPLMP